MRCVSCGVENSSAARFCKECGSELPRICPSCGHEVIPSAKFCNECGARLTDVSKQTVPEPLPEAASSGSHIPTYLTERIVAERTALAARGGTDAERKTVTALFADMAGSTALVQVLEPEEAHRLLDPVLALMMEAVHHYESYVAKRRDDGILALFGAPIAREDHAQRALYAALRMQESMRGYADRIRLERAVPLQIRVGINTGDVVVRWVGRDDLNDEYEASDPSLQIASRMAGVAAPGSIVVSEHTQKLTEGYFEFKAVGTTQVKGVSDPLTVYEVIGVGPLRTRLQVAARRGLARFVGRQRELMQLQKAWEQTKAGQGQIVGCMGEPGVGKSRLFYEFKLLSQRGCLVMETFSLSHGKAYPYLPLIELLKNYFQITGQDDERRRREKVTGKVLTLDRGLEDILPYLFHLVGIGEATSALPQMDLEVRRQRTFEAIKRLLVRESLNQPVELIFEDLHWLDSETQAFLVFFSESIATARIMLLVNYRPEFRHDWGNQTFYTQLRLDPLGQAEAGELLTSLLGDEPTLAPLKEIILEKTEGIPFFTEEVVRTLAEEHVLRGEPGHYQLERTPTDVHIPPTVQGVLAARMDRLDAPQKGLLQTLSVIGKEFPWSLLKQVTEQPEDELRRGLASLQTAEFIFERPAFPELEYSFKHALTQEVAYHSLLAERRAALHVRTAAAIEALHRNHLEDHYSELALHYSRSSNIRKAAQYLQLAGQQALHRSAYNEAIHYFTGALEFVARLPDGPERNRDELALQLALGPARMAAKGHGAPEVEATYTRALVLCRELGAPQHFPALYGLRTFYFVHGDLLRTRELSQQLLAVAQRTEDTALLVQAYRALGASLFNMGELEAARANLEKALALYDPQKHRSHVFVYGSEPGVLGLSEAAWVMWHLGYPDRALENNEKALTLAQELGHPNVLAYVLTLATNCHQCRGEVLLTRERAEAAVSLATDQGLPLIVAAGGMLRGWALTAQGQCNEGIAQLRQSLSGYRATGAKIFLTYFLALLAESLGKAEQAEEGLQVVAEALAFVRRTEERIYEAELHRLQGELTLKSAGSKEQAQAELCFESAIRVAHGQGSKSLELRARKSLARLWQQQGKRAEAHRMLAEIYSGFTEGCDTADLLDAKTLLAELAEA